MERAVAVKKLGKILGKKLGYSVDSRAPSPEERAEAKSKLFAAREERDRLKVKKDERYKAILAADVEYQSLHAAAKAASDQVNELSGITQHYKITVGIDEGFFFLIKATGDTWEEILSKLEEKSHA